MLTQAHINQYTISILEAYKVGMNSVIDAERNALRVSCRGCMYCRCLEKHKEVMQYTLPSLLLLASGLKEGECPKQQIPKIMTAGKTVYRGFITDTGEYIPLFGTSHDKFRQRYTDDYGEDRAYRMIAVHAPLLKTEVLFFDRKYPPNETQFATLRDLMIDAEGALRFNFAYDTNHPTL